MSGFDYGAGPAAEPYRLAYRSSNVPIPSVAPGANVDFCDLLGVNSSEIDSAPYARWVDDDDYGYYIVTPGLYQMHSGFQAYNGTPGAAFQMVGISFNESGEMFGVTPSYSEQDGPSFDPIAWRASYHYVAASAERFNSSYPPTFYNLGPNPVDLFSVFFSIKKLA